MSRTITEGSVDLDKFTASRVRQVAKKFESSKATVCHIKQVAGDLQATQIYLMRCQSPEFPTNRHNKKRRPTGKQKPDKTPESPATNQVKKPYDNRKTHKIPNPYNKCGDSIHAQDFNALQRSTNAKYAKNMVTFQVYAIKRRLRCITRTAAETPKHINIMQA